MNHKKTINKLLKFYKKEFNAGFHIGLCKSSNMMLTQKLISVEEHTFLVSLISSERYSKELAGSDLFCSDEYIWGLDNKVSRLEWLAKQEERWSGPFIHEITVYSFCDASPFGVVISEENLERYSLFVPEFKSVPFVENFSQCGEHHPEDYMVVLEKLLHCERGELHLIYEVGLNDEISDLCIHLDAPYKTVQEGQLLPNILSDIDGYCELGVIMLK